MTDKGLFGLTMSLLCIWLILDNFYGKQYISTFIDSFIPNVPVKGDDKQ